ncbi:MAG: RNA-binding S4 domain-containing protein [Armatimonadota bacterium]|nr:RNA-binding S4 domain-containing protein [Armatimonadota bacterium]
MRLDKFLQVSRLVKRRTLANRLCNAGRVTLNGQRAKPSAEIDAGDLISVNFGTRRVTARVTRVPSGRPSPDAIVEILDDQRIQDAW